jgi:hypothetical protein
MKTKLAGKKRVDSRQLKVEREERKKADRGRVGARASWGAAVLRPYNGGGQI